MEQSNNSLPQTPNPSEAKKFPKWAWLLVCLAGVAIVAGASWWLASNVSKEENEKLRSQLSLLDEENVTTDSSSESTSTTAPPSSGGTNYVDPSINFSIVIPEGYGIFKRDIISGIHEVEFSFGNVTKDNIISLEGEDSSNYFRISGGKRSNYSKFNLADELEAYEKDKLDIFPKNDIEVDGQPGVRYQLGGMMSGITVISVKDRYKLEAQVYGLSDENEAIFDEIISSFRWPE